MKHCIDNLERNRNSLKFLGKHVHIMNSAGPSFLTKMVYTHYLNKILQVIAMYVSMTRAKVVTFSFILMVDLGIHLIL